jgi:hypothetical protein
VYPSCIILQYIYHISILRCIVHALAAIYPPMLCPVTIVLYFVLWVLSRMIFYYALSCSTVQYIPPLFCPAIYTPTCTL